MKRRDCFLRMAFALSFLSLACVSRPTGAQDQGKGGKGNEGAVSSQGKASANWETALDGQAVEVSGRIRRVGSDPLSRLVITDADGHDWSLDKEGQKTLALREERDVRVSAIVRLRPQVLGNGKRLPDKRELTQVRLLE